MSYYIGVVGKMFNSATEKSATVESYRLSLKEKLREAMERKTELEDVDFDDRVYVVTGQIKKGVNLLVSDMLPRLDFGHVTVDCRRSQIYETFQKDEVTEMVIKGENYGDENELFVRNIDILIVVGKLSERDEDKIRVAGNKGIPVLL